jgi:magnesium chelatase family protein
LEDNIVSISRARGSAIFPSNFILVAAMNPCPCGFYNDPAKECICSQSNIQKYQKKISGPLLDRIDLYLEVPRVKYQKLTKDELMESSKNIRNRVELCREIQNDRFKGTKVKTNSSMSVKDIKKYCQISDETKTFIKKAAVRFNLSARSFHKILKIARTVADLEKTEKIELKHIAEALQYRPKEN